MSWLFSQALGAELSVAKYSDGEPFAQLNVMLTPQQFWRNDKMMDCSKPSLFGLTLQHLTANRGEELLTLFRAGFRAKILAWPEKAQALTAIDQDCGASLPALLGMYDPDTHLLKTAQCSLLGDSTECLVTLPPCGTMRSGSVYLRPNVVRNTNETESGFWATPTTMDKLPPKSEAALFREFTIARPGRSKPANLRDQVSNMDKWPTPTANEHTGAGHSENKKGPMNLRTIVRLFPTPRANDAKKGGNFNVEDPRNGLPAAAKKYPTPVASMHKGSSPKTLTRASGRDRTNDRLDHNVMATDGGQLNPDWVELLMGWPRGWTRIEPQTNGTPAINWADDWEGDTPRVATEKTPRADRLKAIGNGQVPLVAAIAFTELIKRIKTY